MSWAKLLKEKSALASALDLVGDHWTIMIITGCLAGYRRFNQIESHLGINRNLLKTKLDILVKAGIFEKKPHKEKSKHYEYLPTEMCFELRPVIIGLASWGEKFLTKHETPITNKHSACGGSVHAKIYCKDCEDSVPAVDVVMTLNSGAGEITSKIVETQNVA